MTGWKEISSFVLKYDYCCGCGACAGVCPQNALEIRFNEYGEYKPYRTGNCTDCGLCSKVCPFVNGNPNEDDIGKAKFADIPGIKHTPETGYYLQSYVGYAADPEIRWNGASGGLTTWLLCTLLEKGLIDYVITVAPTGNSDKLFEYRVLNNTKEIRACSKSAYYPVELSGVLQHIQKNPGRYAIVGLPCFIKGVELARRCVSAIDRRIAFTVGLTCGQLKSKRYAEHIAQMMGIAPPLRNVDFRVKSIDEPANNFAFEAEDTRGNRTTLLWDQGVSQIWCSGLFQLNPCSYCDDLFSECADIALLDAWLSPYSTDPHGTNLAIDRKNLLHDTGLFDASRQSLNTIPIGSIIDSQRGPLVRKRSYIKANTRGTNTRHSMVKRATLHEPPNLFRRLKNHKHRLQVLHSRRRIGGNGTFRPGLMWMSSSVSIGICNIIIRITDWLYGKCRR